MSENNTQESCPTNLSIGEFERAQFIRVWSILGKISNDDILNEILAEGGEFTQGFSAKCKIQEDIDATIVQCWIRSNQESAKVSLETLVGFANTLSFHGKLLEIQEFLQVQDFILLDTDISQRIQYHDVLLYDICFKKHQNVRILYSGIIGNEFLTNFFKHICYFELFYAKIERFYVRFKGEIYPQIRSAHAELIQTCSQIIDHKKTQWTEGDIRKLSGWSLAIDELNFALKYDYESIESNYENMKSRLRTIGASEIRYFQNHLEKAEFVLKTFEMAEDKNNLIKETILKNGIHFIETRREEQKITNESERIHHFKNIKELVGGLAFIEIGVNGIAEGIKIIGVNGVIPNLLANTAFMRAVCIFLCIIGYFLHYFYKYLSGKSSKNSCLESE